MKRGLASVSAVALVSALGASGAQAQFTALPTITIGHTHAVEHSHPGQPSHSHPVYHTHAVPATRQAAPSPVAPPPPPVAKIVAPIPESSSEKFFTGAEVTAYPYSRPSESLEVVPGLVVTQHSGDGKANQYFLRGFNLDHGTDLALWLDGMPLNMRTHGHGQGWADSNFLIPELLSYIIARKGPYSAEDGDFSSAGTVQMQYIDRIDRGYFGITGGSFGYARAFAIQPFKDDRYGGDAYGAVEANYYNGPWERGDDLKKINAILRWTRGTQEDGMAVTAMAYANKWFSTDQLPDRAVWTGYKSLWGTMDPTDGGTTSRFSLSGRWSQTNGNQYSRVEAYAVRSTLELYNNFTYFLGGKINADGYDLGDQFRQFDRRTMVGVNARHGINWDIAGFPVETRVGFQGRYDDIRLGLQQSVRRNIFETTGNDYANVGSVGFWTDTTVHLTPWLRATGGARVDYYNANINSIQGYWDAPKVFNGGVPFVLWTGPYNSGSTDAAIVSPKGSIVIGPWYNTEMFLNYGEGFHSTDARGTVQRFSASETSEDGGYLAVNAIPLLVKSRGAEIGWRTRPIEGLESSVSLWWLDFDSENQYVGDAGTTEFGRPSRRYGIELANHYKPVSWLMFDGNVALVHARYRGAPDQAAWDDYEALKTPEALPYGAYFGNAPGNYVINAPAIVATGGLELGEATGWFGGMKYRYFGSRPLTPDGYFQGPATGTFNVRLGYRWDDGWRFQLDAFNIFNSRSDQITYAYGSLTQADALYGQCRAGAAPEAVCATGVMGRHFKPVEPPAVRATFGGPLDFSHLPDLTKPFKDLGLL